MTKTDGRVLALDLGTSSARALVLSASDASPVPGGLARYKISPNYATGGSATLDLHEYVEGLLGCLDELQQNGHLDDIGAIVLSSQWHSIVALDNNGSALTPVITWADTRSVELDLGSSFDEHAFHARTGSWLHRLYWTRRIPWLLSEGSPAGFAGLPDLVLVVVGVQAPLAGTGRRTSAPTNRRRGRVECRVRWVRRNDRGGDCRDVGRRTRRASDRRRS